MALLRWVGPEKSRPPVVPRHTSRPWSRITMQVPVNAISREHGVLTMDKESQRRIEYR